MKIWDDIVNSAMLGTEKPAPGHSNLPEQLSLIFEQINRKENLDRASKFLQQAATVYNYRKSGFQPLKNNDLQVLMAENEIQSYVSNTAALALSKVLNEGNLALLELWMQSCCTNEQLIPPDFLPEILEKAIAHHPIRKLLVNCAGNRGKWLSQFNPDWDHFSPDLSEDEIWLTGKPDERVALLKSIRATEPDRARAMIMQTWPLENAAQKLEFLKVIQQNKQIADLDWLESLSAEKGQKVKDEIQNLLCRIPGSSIIQKYQLFLAEAFSLKKEKALLGILNKTVLQFTFPAVVDESIYKSGIEKLVGANSKFTDEEYITAQIMQYVPPVFWEGHFETTPDQIIAYFVKYGDRFLGSFATAISNFEHKAWIPYLVEQPTFYANLLAMMAPSDREKYLLRFKENLPNDVIHHALGIDQEWSVNFAKNMLQLMFADYYRFNLNTYRKQINLIPVALIPHLENIVPDNINHLTTLENIKQELRDLLTLKQQVQQAF